MISCGLRQVNWRIDEDIIWWFDAGAFDDEGDVDIMK
jgi:hypothetical protein